MRSFNARLARISEDSKNRLTSQTEAYLKPTLTAAYWSSWATFTPLREACQVINDAVTPPSSVLEVF